jgi:phage gp16-like protein
MIAILSILGLVLFYLFILLPTQVKKEVLLENKSYSMDKKNLIEVIKRAQNIQNIKDCFEAVYMFKKRNKKVRRVKKDTDLLISLVDERYSEIKKQMSHSY